MTAGEWTRNASRRKELLGVSEREIELGDSAIALVDMVGKLLVEMREKEHLTQSELADMIGLSGAGRISQFESGQLRHAVNLKSLAKIAAVLGYDLKIEAVKSQAAQSIGIEVGVTGRDHDRVYHGREGNVAAVAEAAAAEPAAAEPAEAEAAVAESG